MKIKSIGNHSVIKQYSVSINQSVFFQFITFATPKILETKAGSPKYLMANLGALI